MKEKPGMAKKKSKRTIKLNNKIRELFGGNTFDDGVEGLENDVLIELSLIANLSLKSLDRGTLVGALRRTWSEGTYHVRKNILSYLSGRHKSTHGRISATQGVKERATVADDKVETIISILNKIEHSREEEEEILAKFIEVRLSKITYEKISNTLHYMRLNQIVKSLEDATGVYFGTLGEFEFYHTFSFAMDKHDFSKTLLVLSEGIDIGNKIKDSQNNKDLIDLIEREKALLVANKQEKINNLIAELYSRPHPYLNHAEIELLIRNMPPESNLEYIPIDPNIVEKIIADNSNNSYTVHHSDNQYIIEQQRSIDMHGNIMNYTAKAIYDINMIHDAIWKGIVPLPIDEDIQTISDRIVSHYNAYLSELYNELKALTMGIAIDNDIIWKHIFSFLDSDMENSNNPKKAKKTLRRILYHFGEYLRPLKEKKMREELLAKTIRDFKNLFPMARGLRRRILFYAGPTNSGKTYSAMKDLKSAQSGYYLAPLRLLALEGYESLKEQGISVSLITGEEEIIDDESTHISSTIEMLNFDVDVECCVIDEIQMIADRDRGWAWANALIGAPAKTIILTGSTDAVTAVRELAEYLDEDLEVIYFDRKNPLYMMTNPTPVKEIKPNTAIVAFSRKEVLTYKQRLSGQHSVSVVYGNLSPEVRREEARKFREGESDILVATDAIAMGLNLPIRTLLFSRDNKFDGIQRRELTTSEILQISGRAGRYGMHEYGYIGALDKNTLRTIERNFHGSLPDIELPFSVMASMHHVVLIGEILETEKLLDILTFFADNMEFEGPFLAANIESMLEIAALVDEYNLDLNSRYHLATAPVGINSPYIESAFHRYLKLLERGESVPHIPSRDLPSHAHTNQELLNAEDRVKEASLYLWLGFRFPDKFPDSEIATESRRRLNRFIEKSLAKGDFSRKCTRCGKVLEISHRYSICESCYRNNKQGSYRRGSRRQKR